MRIVTDFPPNWDEIKARFGPPPTVICAWGDVIYNPSGQFLSEALIAHETVHGHRQRPDIVGWWRRYIDEPSFRLAEEIPAHQMEYRVAMKTARNRGEQRRAMKQIAKRLSGPLYGRLITAARAQQILKEAA